MDDTHLTIALLTLGDPNTLTGGYLYHRRIADLAPCFRARIQFVSFPERRFPLAVLDAPRVMRKASRGGTQAVVLDSIAAAFLGPWLRIRHVDLPIVPMLHQPPGGIDHGPLRATVQAWLDRLAYRRAAVLMVASDALADDLVAEGVPRSRLHVVPPGRDVAPAAAPHSGDLRRNRQAAFLCVGNWVERKGILSLLNAFALLEERTATLHLVGDSGVDPEYTASVRARLAQPDLVDRVVFHGKRTIEEVAGLYAAADAFVLPSLKEPYGTVYGEAMAFGLPVVGWRAGNLPYLAEHGREGLIVEPGDTAGLARAMRTLAENVELRQRLGEAARRRALGRPTWEQTAQTFFDVVRSVVMNDQRLTANRHEQHRPRT